MSPLALIAGITLGVGLWSIVSGLLPTRPADLSYRIAPYVLDVSAAARKLVQEKHDDPVVVFGYLLQPPIKRCVALVDSVVGGGTSRATTLSRSGSEESLVEFGARRVTTGIIGLALGVLVGALGALSSSQQGVLSVLVGGLVGFACGLWWVDYRMTRLVQERDQRVREEFPTIVELLGLALAAGDSLPRALARVARRSQGELGREWARVMNLVELGAPLASSLRESALRVGGGHVSAFVEHLAQALDQGAPLGEVVSAHASDAKEEYTRSLVDRAGKAEVQMLVPMVLLILPITVIFAVYPGLEALRFEF